MRTVLLLFTSIIITLIFSSCTTKEEIVKNKTPMKTRSEGKFIVSAPIVLKGGDGAIGIGGNTEKKDMYVQQSVQDYYIKFCESTVTREEMEKALKKEKDLIKVLKLEIEYKDGNMDVCPQDPRSIAGRKGRYVIVHRIVG